MPNRRQILASLAALPVSLLATPSQATMPMIFASGGLAINGYDPVSYFTEAKPLAGNRKQAVMWKGAIWQFSSARNRVAFESNPWVFAPRYGGYCAYAMSIGKTLTTDPMAWRIHSNQLFLIHNMDTKQVWLRDIAGNIDRANQNWPAILRR